MAVCISDGWDAGEMLRLARKRENRGSSAGEPLAQDEGR